MNDFNIDYFLDGYNGNYRSFWVERFGLIPELPTSFDNANSIYELIAWLQRAFKILLDDYLELESELEDFQNAMTELLQYLIPKLMRDYAHSNEYRNLLKELLKSILKDPDMKDFIKNYLKELLKDPDFKNVINDLLGVNTLKDDVNALKDRVKQLESENAKLNDILSKIVNNLENSGAWENGNFKPDRNIATGNINVFGGSPDGSSFIRTNNGQSENDLAGGLL